MAIASVIPEGTRVRIRRGRLPLDPAVIGRSGIVADASEYHAYRYGVLLDGTQEQRYFAPDELEVMQQLELPAEREEAKRRPALP
jgi:hypothetical protein